MVLLLTSQNIGDSRDNIGVQSGGLALNRLRRGAVAEVLCSTIVQRHKSDKAAQVQGGRRRGRQRKRWEDNIKDWTGLEWNTILRKAENREEWRKLVVKSTVVPQRSARLRDR